MSDINKLNEEQLDGVSGGAYTSRYGNTFDNAGNVKFKGQLDISAADWKWLMTQYKGKVDDPEYYASTVPINDIKTILDQHHAGQR